jgi:hypothetical protein
MSSEPLKKLAVEANAASPARINSPVIALVFTGLRLRMDLRGSIIRKPIHSFLEAL